MFHHILFPIDFSERCKQVVPYVQAVARRHGAKVTLMSVVQLPAMWYGGIDSVPVLFDVDKMENDARRELAVFYAGPGGAAPDHETHVVVTRGVPGLEITQYAAAADIDLIMMPTHGYGRFRRLLVGSVTAQVLHDAHCAVWTAAHAEEVPGLVQTGCKKILCAVDDTAGSLPIIRQAAALAGELAAEVTLVHAVPFFGDPEAASAFYDINFFLDAAKKKIAGLQAAAGTKFVVCVAAGGVSSVVRDAAVGQKAELIVIGRGRSQERFGGLKTNAYAIIRDSPCPVLSF